MSLPGVGGRRPSGAGRQVLKRALLALAALSAAVLAYAQFVLGHEGADGALILVRPAWVTFDGNRYAGCQFGYLSGSVALDSVLFVAIGAGEHPDSMRDRDPVAWDGRIKPPVDELQLDTWRTVHLMSNGFKTGMGFLWPVAAHPSGASGPAPVSCQVQGKGTMHLVTGIPTSQRVRDAGPLLAVVAGLSAAIAVLLRGGGGA